MDYSVLSTLSGTPAFSNEQRQYYNRKQQEIKDTLGEFCYLDPEFKKFPMFTRYFDYQMFLKIDLKNQATHPIHLYMKTLQLFFKQCDQNEHDLKTQLEFNEITEEEYNDKINEINIKKILAQSEFDLTTKQKIKKYNYKYLS